MEPLAIVESFPERKDLLTRFVPCVVCQVMDELILQGTEETLGHRVVVTVALAAHTGREAK
jgi:hypothetical protein